jgi:uncharacterized membrane-anchored protein YhcB (DUF1043 family)
MESPQATLLNAETLVEAAEAETAKLNESSTEIPHEVDVEKQAVNSSIQDVKDMMKNMNLGEMLKRLNSNPAEVQKMMAESMSQMTPEMQEQARKMASGGQGEQLARQIQQQRVDPRALQAQMAEQKRILQGTASKQGSKDKKVIFINKNRTLKVRSIPEASISASAIMILKASSPVQLPCSRLALGPLAGKTITVWHDPEQKGKNRRTSKILGFTTGSPLLIVMEEGDLIESDFLAAEAQLA